MPLTRYANSLVRDLELTCQTELARRYVCHVKVKLICAKGKEEREAVTTNIEYGFFPYTFE